MRICPIASGSSGNSIYIGSDNTHVLIDCGISGKKVRTGVESLDLDMSDISAILVTHEHSDHIKGLGVIARRYGIPIYATQGTLDAIVRTKETGEIDPGLLNPVEADKRFEIGDLNINPMHVSHDAVDPVAYRVYCGCKKCAVVTDLGVYTDYTVQSLEGMDALVIESNHDINMLQVGSYPYPLKQRILSEFGHLSNDACGQLLCRILHDGMKHIFLGHLSHENNLPELAFESVRTEITVSDTTPYKGGDFPITVAKRHEVSRCVSF
ncbi:MAG: MBL fold metallo-hydrolase [Lachnospiraceae bacterium]|nr:MBL fold metallo-hydrolase [Lachnospiraceae bacterium]